MLTALTFAQAGHKLRRGIYFNQLMPTVQVLPVSASSIRIFYLYRIPYDLLVFQRDKNGFSSSLRIQIEVNEDDKFVTREMKEITVSVADFERTESGDECIQGFITFDLPPGNYLFKGTAADLNSNKELTILPVEVKGIEGFEKGIYRPIIINAGTKCNGKNFPNIVNRGGSIPYSSIDYQVVIPVRDTTVQYLTVTLRNGDDELFTRKIDEVYTTGLSISVCEEKLFISKNDSMLTTKNFILRNFSRSLDEGVYLLAIKLNEEDEDEDEINFPLAVKWIDKPISLRNAEFAIEMLKYIEEDSVISRLLDADDYTKALYNYWKKYDPTPATSFNELMAEFYSRIDYAALEFRGLAKKNGITTDRGKIYIKYGEPDKIERYSNENGYMIEKWTYKNPDKKFIFVDKQGTGNFILVEG